MSFAVRSRVGLLAAPALLLVRLAATGCGGKVVLDGGSEATSSSAGAGAQGAGGVPGGGTGGVSAQGVGGAASQGPGGAGGPGNGGAFDAGTPCSPGTMLCGGECVDAQTDPANCGACGDVCAAGETCVAGACALTCDGGAVPCGDVCTSTGSDPQNCGACGQACAPLMICAAGSCLGAPTEGLALWLRADVGVTVQGGAVQGWLDQSGLANNASAPSPAAAPAYVAAGLNGEPTVRFNGATTFLTAPDSPSLDYGTSVDFSVVLVVSAGPAVPLTGIVSKAQQTNPAFHGWQVHVRDATPNFAEEIIASPFSGAAEDSSLDIQDGVFRILTVVFQRSPAFVSAYGDGASIQSEPFAGLAGDLTTSDPLRIGTERSELNFLQGEIAEILIYDVALDDPTRIAVETYLSEKYAIATANNPSP